MIRLFSSTDKSFESNGDVVLMPLKAKVHKEDNGDFYLGLETGLQYVNSLVEGNIVVANTPQGEQAFRVTNVTKTKTKLTAKCWHVFYDAENYLIADSNVVDKNCEDALRHLNYATEPETEFNTYSDVGTVNSFRCVRKSFYEAVQTVIERWGGHLVRDNFNISILSEIGQDNGVTVQYSKNLKDISCEENWDSVVTKLLPVGKDGILLNELDATKSIYVTSEIQYSIPYTKTVSFDQSDIEEDDYKDADGNLNEQAYKQALVSDLLTQATQYVEQNSVPQVNYSLKANIEKITDIGDIIEVIDDRLGINLTTNVIAYDYDCIIEQYSEIEFGNFKQSLSGLVSNVTASAEKTATDVVQNATLEIKNEIKTTTESIIGTLKNSYVIYSGDNILILDTLPKESAENVIQIANNGISFSDTGIDGVFKTVWTIENELDFANVDVLNLVADMIKGGTLSLGSYLNSSGKIRIYDDANVLIGAIDKNGISMIGNDGSEIVFNNSEGFAVFDRNGNKIHSLNGNELLSNSIKVEEELNLFSKVRFLPMQVTGTLTNNGVGIVFAYNGD